MQDNVVISLGGSLIIPDQVDVEFLQSFRKVILDQVEKGRKFVIITGGGKVCRRYQNAAKELVSEVAKEDLDWIGIASLKLNAELVRVMFGDYAHSEVIANLEEPFSSDKPIIIGSAYKPGHSTDTDAVFAAETIKADTIINLSNTDHVYEADPRTNPDAKKFEKISWSEYRSLIPEEWDPGLSTPFDPIASKRSEELGLKVIIMNGKPAQNLQNYLNNEDFLGTTIS